MSSTYADIRIVPTMRRLELIAMDGLSVGFADVLEHHAPGRCPAAEGAGQASWSIQPTAQDPAASLATCSAARKAKPRAGSRPLPAR